jgi:hypothetical protein
LYLFQKASILRYRGILSNIIIFIFLPSPSKPSKKSSNKRTPQAGKFWVNEEGNKSKEYMELMTLNNDKRLALTLMLLWKIKAAGSAFTSPCQALWGWHAA